MTLNTSSEGILTLVRDLEDRPEHLMLLLAFVARVFGILEFVLEFEESIFDVLETVGRGFAVLCCPYGRHVDNRESCLGEGRERKRGKCVVDVLRACT